MVGIKHTPNEFGVCQRQGEPMTRKISIRFFNDREVRARGGRARPSAMQLNAQSTRAAARPMKTTPRWDFEGVFCIIPPF